jgi:hypothetical protein
MGCEKFTETAHSSPVFQAGDEWAFLIWGLGGVLHSVVDSAILWAWTINTNGTMYTSLCTT